MPHRIGLLGLVHDHIWHHVPELVQRPDVVLAAADPHPPLLEKIRREYGVERTYLSYEELLDKERPEAVLVYLPNGAKAEVVEMAANRGIHIWLEKPFAARLAQAERMLAAARANGVLLMVNWPTAWHPAIVHALELARQGVVGEIFQVRVRMGHTGPKEYGCSEYFWRWLYDRHLNGAGAYIDYCCYGANIIRYLLGQPTRVMAMAGRLQKTYITVDDNAVLLTRHHHAIGIAEASWTQVGQRPTGGPIIYGSDGVIIVHREGGTREGHVVRTGQVEVITRQKPQGEIIDPPELPVGRRSATEFFLRALETGEPITGLCSDLIARDTQEILEAGLIAIETGQEVSLPLDTRIAV